MNMKSAQMGSFSIPGRKSKLMFNSVAKSLLREGIDNNNKLVEGSNLKTLLSIFRLKPSNIFGAMNPVEDQSTEGDKNKRNAESVGDGEEFYKSSPEKERKRISESCQGASCIMRCHCKKSKCVKLYCECFAAGFYCVETCSCQECENIKECEDIVLEAREVIKTRNPLAFAPKVVQQSIEPSARVFRENATSLTPSSARHKRGCSCKKSMCLKKYCECYQLNVGCSDGCRCQGCGNVYGQKGENGIILKDPMGEGGHNQRTESSSFYCFDTVAARSVSSYTDMGTDQDLTPLSPPFLCSNQQEEVANICSSLENYLMSPDFSFPLDNNDSVLETDKETLYPLVFNQETGLSYAETRNAFQVPYHKPEETVTCSGVSNSKEWTNSSAPRFPSGTKPSSQNCHGPPFFPAAKLDQVVAFEHELLHIMKDNQPETGMEPSASLYAVRVTSQTKKRVSPPHDPVQELGSSSSLGSHIQDDNN